MATFKQVLSSIATSGEAIRRNVQSAVVMAIAHYNEHGDTGYLTDLMKVAVTAKSIRTQTLKDFIKAHANVAWSKNKKGDLVFKKVGKEVKTKPITTQWYDFNSAGVATKDVDAIARAKTLMTALRKALADNETHLKEGQEEIAMRLVGAIDGVLKA